MLPVSEPVLRRHQEAVSNLHARFKAKKAAERQQQAELAQQIRRHDQHQTHFAVASNVLQVGGRIRVGRGAAAKGTGAQRGRRSASRATERPPSLMSLPV